ncbi:Manganese/iron superoxide dismutase [Crepidotus variabilis]|uniref:Manganese/iron superoxide dismutase n=1 Tax=Crepidotus variabilis TaxID=179855 RepID=A0A9P6EUA3_9AGAR|nr:Manganese/iron superoxide dismutase [Crepidotus variabilis]
MASILRRTCSKAPRATSLLYRSRNLGVRHAHTPRPLPYPVEGGLGKFLPPDALRTMEEYQDGLLQRLNEELRTDMKAEAHSSVAQIALNYSARTERTLGFNYAVLALNNSFFLDNLAPPPAEESGFNTHQYKISDTLLERIRQDYGDFPRLKSTFSAAALGMFTNGWVWFVTDSKGHLGIIPTFGPSTLLVRSRVNMGYSPVLFRETATVSEDNGPSTPPLSNPLLGHGTPPGVGPSSPASGLSMGRPPLVTPLGQNRAYSGNSTAEDIVSPNFSSSRADNGMSERGVLHAGGTLYPLFCIPTYEHAWMSAGFGVWGKEDWLKEFWTVLDWEKISRLYISARQL